jgi:carbon-monoxide dehydrogenase small subunit
LVELTRRSPAWREPLNTDRQIVRLRVNGDPHEVGVPTHFTLLESLRYVIGLTGSKQGCDKGDCGACTVLIEGVPTLSCITPVWEAEGLSVVTVEGLSAAGHVHPLQDAFDLSGAAQCGFCTPGILCSAAALLESNARPDLAEIREALSGNLCRCTGYTKIYDAVLAAGVRIAAGESGLPDYAAPAVGDPASGAAMDPEDA